MEEAVLSPVLLLPAVRTVAFSSRTARLNLFSASSFAFDRLTRGIQPVEIGLRLTCISSRLYPTFLSLMLHSVATLRCTKPVLRRLGLTPICSAYFLANSRKAASRAAADCCSLAFCFSGMTQSSCIGAVWTKRSAGGDHVCTLKSMWYM